MISCDEEQLIVIPEIKNNKVYTQAKAVSCEVYKLGAAEIILCVLTLLLPILVVGKGCSNSFIPCISSPYFGIIDKGSVSV